MKKKKEDYSTQYRMVSFQKKNSSYARDDKSTLDSFWIFYQTSESIKAKNYEKKTYDSHYMLIDTHTIECLEQ